MGSLLDGVKAYETLAQRASDPKEVERCLNQAKQLKNLDEKLKKIKRDDIKLERRLRTNFGNLILSLKATTNDSNRVRNDEIIRSLQKHFIDMK